MKRTTSILNPALGGLLCALMLILPASAVVAGTLPGGTFQAILDEAAASGTPALAARVETADGESWSGAAGVTRVVGDDTMPDSLFRLFSIAKAMGAATAFTLIDEGVLGSMIPSASGSTPA